MQLQDVYSPKFIHNINQLFHKTIIDPQLTFDGAIPVETFVQNLGYHIQLQTQLQPVIVNFKQQQIELDNTMPLAKQRFYLSQAFGKIVYWTQTKAFLKTERK